MGMKTNLKLILIVLITLVGLTIYGKITGVFNIQEITSLSKVQDKTSIQQMQTPQERILGVWIMEKDPENKIEFLADGHVRIYVNNILEVDNTYTISNQCEGVVSENELLYLRTVDGEDGTVECQSILNGVYDDNADTLTLLTGGQGKIIVYHRI